MTAGKKPPTGPSVIVDMAKAFYEAFYRGGEPIVAWDSLNHDDQTRYIDAAEASVAVIPDELLLKYRGAAAPADTGTGRRAILADHKHAKRSVLYGR